MPLLPSWPVSVSWWPSLDVCGCEQLTDTGLDHVAQLTQLTSLVLCGCDKITDTGLQHVAQLTQLTSLDLSFCKKITNAGLENVAKLLQLTSLDYSRSLTARTTCFTVTRSRLRGWSTSPSSRSSTACNWAALAA